MRRGFSVLFVAALILAAGCSSMGLAPSDAQYADYANGAYPAYAAAVMARLEEERQGVKIVEIKPPEDGSEGRFNGTITVYAPPTGGPAAIDIVPPQQADYSAARAVGMAALDTAKGIGQFGIGGYVAVKMVDKLTESAGDQVSITATEGSTVTNSNTKHYTDSFNDTTADSFNVTEDQSSGDWRAAQVDASDRSDHSAVAEPTVVHADVVQVPPAEPAWPPDYMVPNEPAWPPDYLVPDLTNVGTDGGGADPAAVP